MRCIFLLLFAIFLASCDSDPSKPKPPKKGDLVVLADVRATSSRVEYVFDRVLTESPGGKSTYKKGDLLASHVLPGPGERLPDQMIIFLEQKPGGSFVPTESQAVFEGKIPATGLSVADFEEQLKGTPENYPKKGALFGMWILSDYDGASAGICLGRK